MRTTSEFSDPKLRTVRLAYPHPSTKPTVKIQLYCLFAYRFLFYSYNGLSPVLFASSMLSLHVIFPFPWHWFPMQAVKKYSQNSEISKQNLWDFKFSDLDRQYQINAQWNLYTRRRKKTEGFYGSQEWLTVFSSVCYSFYTFKHIPTSSSDCSEGAKVVLSSRKIFVIQVVVCVCVECLVIEGGI